jgi:hypothetical protein
MIWEVGRYVFSPSKAFTLMAQDPGNSDKMYFVVPESGTYKCYSFEWPDTLNLIVDTGCVAITSLVPAIGYDAVTGDLHYGFGGSDDGVSSGNNLGIYDVNITDSTVTFYGTHYGGNISDYNVGGLVTMFNGYYFSYPYTTSGSNGHFFKRKVVDSATGSSTGSGVSGSINNYPVFRKTDDLYFMYNGTKYWVSISNENATSNTLDVPYGAGEADLQYAPVLHSGINVPRNFVEYSNKSYFFGLGDTGSGFEILLYSYNRTTDLIDHSIQIPWTLTAFGQDYNIGAVGWNMRQGDAKVYFGSKAGTSTDSIKSVNMGTEAIKDNYLLDSGAPRIHSLHVSSPYLYASQLGGDEGNSIVKLRDSDLARPGQNQVLIFG